MGYRKSRLDIMSEQKKLNIIKSILGEFYNKSDEYLFYCPKCDHHKKKLSVNFSKNVFKCWVCDWSGRDTYRIVRRYGDYHSKKEWRAFDQQVEVGNFYEKLFGKTELEEAQKIELPDEFVSLANKNLPKGSLYPLNYLRSRSVNKRDIIAWKIGYCPSGKYAGRVVVPSFDNDGDVNYFVTRSYDYNWKKYLNPGASRNIVFNHLYLDFEQELTIVEGVFDAIKAGDNSVPLLGSTLTENSKLFYEIVKNDTPVYLALDPDAERKINKVIRLFLKHDVEIYKVDVAPYQDVGEMPKEEFIRRKEKAILLDSNSYLLRRILEIQ